MRDISHEMRTPLNCVTLGLDILLESKDISPEKRHEYLLDVRQSVTVAVQTLNELLMYDKIESDTLKVDKTTVSVLELMETIKTFSLSMISASINFSHNIADVEEELSKFVIDGDLHKLNQVLRNILSNAIKFTPKGGCIAVLVELYEASSDRAMFAVTRYNINSTDILKFNRLKISCTDTGPGISKVYLSCLFLFRALLLLIKPLDHSFYLHKDNQKKLFKSIVQFNPHILQNGGGSGLGLFISDKIMELHEGSMSVHSEGEGKGSTFAITLPITFQSDAPALSTRKISSSKPMINLSDSRMTTPIDESSLLLHETAVAYDGVLSKTLVTILIVDDSAMNRKMISRLFTSSDEFEYNLLEACNGQEGVEAVLGDAESNRIDKIDVILMDNQMPVMDGVTAVNLLRKGGFANLIVMISGDSMNSDSVSMSGCGANHVMLKPISKDVLFDMIRSFIRDK